MSEVEKISVALMGGPLDGRLVRFPRECGCCGEAVAPGAILTFQSNAYVLDADFEHAFYEPAISTPTAEGDKGGLVDS